MLNMLRQTRLLLFMGVLLIGAAVTGEAQTVSLKIIQTTDTHGSFFPYDFIAAKETPTSLAQVFTYVKAQRADAKQQVILLDGGDILQGQPTVYYSNFEKTAAPHLAAEVMNFMQYDAGAVGNHDVEPGHEVYDKIAREFQFPWLAANAVKVGTTEPYFGAYVVLEKAGVKIAILGLTTPGVPNWLPGNLWQGIEYQDMVESAKYWVPLIQEKERPDVLIGLFHAGVDFTYGGATAATPLNENGAELVAQQVPGFDVVFVGHDHQGWNKTITNDAGQTVLILGGLNSARTIAVANLTLNHDEANQTWQKDVQGEIVEVKDFAPDPEFQAHFAAAVAEVKSYVDKPIGKFTQTISTRDAMFGDSAFVDLIHRIQLDLTKADVSFAAPLSFDAAIREGDIFVRDLFNLYKYENLLYTMRLSGQEIKDFLEYSYGKWFNQMQSAADHLIAFKLDEQGQIMRTERTNAYQTITMYYNYDSAAGMNYTVDVSKPVGERLTITSMADGAPFDLTKAYTVAINSYRGNGGGGHLSEGAKIPKAEFSQRMLSSTVQDLRYYLMKWIEKQQTVTPSALGNWTVIPAEWAAQGQATDAALLYHQ